MDKQAQLDALASLKDWTKWILTLTTTIGGGCVLMLQTSDLTGSSRLFLVLAVVAFLIALLMAVWLGRALAVVSEVIPTEKSIFEYRTSVGLTVGRLSQLHFGAFMVAAIFLLTWVVLKLV